MIVRRFPFAGSTLVIASLALLWSSIGCSSGDFGSELSVRPKPHLFDDRDQQTLRLPQDEPFSITLAPTQETPGLNGTAEADAHVSRKGDADATAHVANGGSALAGFQLGHALKNDSDRQMDLHVHLGCAYESEAEATPPGPLPDAQLDLHLYARDGRNRLLREINLVQHSTEEGAASSKDRKEIDFTLTLGPRDSVSIYVAGSVKVDTQEGHAARGAIKLSGLHMQIDTKVAPPVQKAGDEQG